MAAKDHPCTVEGCEKPQWAKGFCSTHYKSHRASSGKKKGEPVLYRQPGVDSGDSTVEARDPEAAAEAIDQMTALRRLEDAAKAAGMPQSAVVALKKRLETRYVAPKKAVERMKSGDMVASLQEKIAMMLDHVDPYSVSQASLKDLFISIGIAIEKMQLLKGEPTQILTVNERSALDELIPAVLEEAKRRGHALEMQDRGDGVYVPSGVGPAAPRLTKRSTGK